MVTLETQPAHSRGQGFKKQMNNDYAFTWIAWKYAVLPWEARLRNDLGLAH